MPLIPEGVIDEIQTRSDIAELIGRYVPLKRAGRHFKAHCPFHKERTPSFMVNTEKQIFHCFGCGVGGNIFSFLMQHDRLTFPEAVRQLADHVGMPLPDRSATSPEGPSRMLGPLMEKACRYFERQLLEPKQGEPARIYLERRGVSTQARGAFRLGFAPEGWNRLSQAAKATGISLEHLEAAGLVIKGKAGYYDRFRHRVMFPILDARGRVVGFGGRGLEGEEPKYLNSPETVLYRKGRHLFGLAQAKDAIIKGKTAVLVEGYFDCVVLVEAGFSHVVSPLGTALTTEQVHLLKRYTEQVILAFDPDAAGEDATLRGIDLLVEAGLQVRVAMLPPGNDPDECVRSHGWAWFQRLLDESVSLLEFLIQSALRRHPGHDAERVVQAARVVLPTIAKVPDAMLRREYVRLLADRLKLDEAAVAEELAKTQPRPHVRQPVATRDVGLSSRSIAQGPERLVTALILDEPSRWTQAQDQLSLESVIDPALRRILTVVDELATAGRSVSPAAVVSRLLEEGLGSLVSALVEVAQSLPSKTEAWQDGIRRLESARRRRELAVLREQIRTVQDAGHATEAQRLLAEYQRRLVAVPTPRVRQGSLETAPSGRGESQGD